MTDIGIIPLRYTRNVFLRAFCTVYLSAFLYLYFQAPDTEMALMQRKEKLSRILIDIQVELPEYLFLLLTYNGYDSMVSLSKIDNLAIEKMETFARNKLSQLLKDEEKKKIFGIFDAIPELFEVVEGDRQLIFYLKDKIINVLKQSARPSPLQKTLSSQTTVEEESIGASDLEQKATDQLKKLIMNYAQNNLKDVSETNMLLIKNINCNVNMNENKARISCSFCSYRTTVYFTIMNAKTGKRKWVPSNFTRHLKICLTNKTCGIENKKAGNKQANLLPFVQSRLRNENLAGRSAPGPSTRPEAELEVQVMDECDLEPIAEVSSLATNSEKTFKQTQKEPKNWKGPKYSRSARNIRNLINMPIDNQRRITEFFDNLVHFVDNSQEVQCLLQNNLKNLELTKSTDKEYDLGNFLKRLLEATEKNYSINKHARTFDDSLKRFALYIFLIGGRMLYETLYRNINNALPSITTIQRLLADVSKITEASLRTEELNIYLTKREYCKKIFVSEDQTALINRTEYDPKTNSIVGFAGPTDKNGFPATGKFIVNSVEDIRKALESYKTSINAYVYMAQPLVDRAPAFVLSVFGTDNAFDNKKVLLRWNHIEQECRAQNIEVLGFSSDGDPRCLKAMKDITRIPHIAENPYGRFFQVEHNLNRTSCIQDTVHIGTKLRTKLLKTGKTPEEISQFGLCMGNKTVSVVYIKEMISRFTKDKHLLSESHLDAQDKMNFDAVEKICSEKSINLLKEISNSKATVQYLSMIRDVLDSFLKKDLSIGERIFKIWNVVFFLRIWKNWLVSSKKSVHKNFITINCYTCIEINAHEILLLLEKCRGEPSCFLPWLMSSQPCEKIFRQTRAMTTTYSTKVNFSILDLLRRLNRIEALGEITSDLGLYGDNGVLPARSLLENSKHQNFSAKIHYQPTLVWLAPYLGLSTSAAIDVLSLLGAFLAFTGIVSQKFCIGPVFAALWSLFFSLFQIGQVFVSNSYDELLLEAGFVAIFMAPFLPSRGKNKVPTLDLFSFWLCRWLLFRYFISAGLGKLISGCPKWWSLSALGYYFETMPLPNPLSWYAYHLPTWTLRLTTVFVNVCELVVPTFFLLPIRSARIAAFHLELFLQTCIVATGNFDYANILIVTLLISLLDDQFFYGKKKSDTKCDILDKTLNIGIWAIVIFGVIKLYDIKYTGEIIEAQIIFSKLQFSAFCEKYLLYALFVVSLTLMFTTCLSVYQVVVNENFTGSRWFESIGLITFGIGASALFAASMAPVLSLHPKVNGSTGTDILNLYNRFHKAHIINNYNLFPKITGVEGRPEIILEGSDNLEGPWKEYNFLYKPGNVNHSLPFVAPYSPKLDWHMYWAAQSTYQQNPWLLSLTHRLLTGKPEVLNLIDRTHSPFANKPPKYIRGVLYKYKFTTWSHRSQPAWWIRETVGEYFPPYTKDSPALEDFLKARNLLPPSKAQRLNPIWKQILDAIRFVANKFEATLLFWSVLTAALAIVASTSLS